MHIVVIGNGVAGTTAALAVRKRRRKWRITLISGESDHFYSRPALMYIYMGHVRFEDTKPYEDWFWERQRIDRVRAWVERIDAAAARVELADGRTIPYDKLLIATGSKPNRFGWPGQDLDRVQGFYDLQDLERLERATPDLGRAVIVGGGLIGIELAEMLRSRGVAVTMLVRETSYWNNALPDEESAMLNPLIRAHGIDLRLETELAEIIDDGRGRACAVVTRGGERIACELVGLTAGVRPNLAAVEGSGIATGRGVRVDRSFRTDAPEVYAAGDCAEIVDADGTTRVEQLWYTGRMHGEVAGAVIAGEDRTYDRGIWFNSAKFLDLEWHTYGQVTPAGRPRPPGERHGWWADESGRHGLRIVVRDGAVVGMNAMGVRQRHRVWERWIAEGRDAGYVLDHLHEANFDPEFSRRHERAIRTALKEQLT